jgi:hypothetical protein
MRSIEIHWTGIDWDVDDYWDEEDLKWIQNN